MTRDSGVSPDHSSHAGSDEVDAPSGMSPSERVVSEKECEQRTTERIEISLAKDERGELGIYVTGKQGSNGDLRYIVADFESGGPAER